MKKLGFIGAGNMAGAILKGAMSGGFLSAGDIAVFDVDERQCRRLTNEFADLMVCPNGVELVKNCDTVIIAVKPIFVRQVLEEVRPEGCGKNFISIAAGWTMEMLRETLPAQSGAKLLRVMPNTPALVGEGFTALCEDTTLNANDFQWAQKLFLTLGTVEVLPERLFDAVVAVSGSSPAYVYLFIEAMADGAVRLGMPRQTAYRAAAQAVLGAAKMVLETGEHPAKLKDDVCSPGGTTIEAVAALERHGMRSAVQEAMAACAEKCRKLV